MVADCVPVVLVGSARGGGPVLGVAHAGRPGVASGVVPAAVARMRDSVPRSISAWIGPSICGRCYEVPAGMRADVAAAVPANLVRRPRAARPDWTCRPGSASQLESAGVAVEYSGGCTLEDDELFSYRRDPATGRFAGLVWTGAADGLTPRTGPAPGTGWERAPMAEQPDPRLAQLRERLAAVRQRIDGAVAAAGRQDTPPQLIVVTKFHPAADVRRLAALGVTDVGENRDQEAADKAAGLGDLGLRWHFIGQLQSNKAKSVVKYAHAVHSVDRPQLAAALAKAMAAEQERTGRGAAGLLHPGQPRRRRRGPPGRRAPRGRPGTGGPAGRIAGGFGWPASWRWPRCGADPVRAFEKLAGISARLTEDHPGGYRHFRRHEPGPRSGRPVRCDTPAHWLRYSRSASGVAVGSTYWKGMAGIPRLSGQFERPAYGHD